MDVYCPYARKKTGFNCKLTENKPISKKKVHISRKNLTCRWKKWSSNLKKWSSFWKNLTSIWSKIEHYIQKNKHLIAHLARFIRLHRAAVTWKKEHCVASTRKNVTKILQKLKIKRKINIARIVSSALLCFKNKISYTAYATLVWFKWTWYKYWSSTWSWCLINWTHIKYWFINPR